MPPRRWKRYARCERGIAALEFALVAPFLILLVLGGFETARFIMVQQKVEKTAFTLADVTAQYDPETGPDIQRVFAAVEQIMQPYSFQADGLVILSSIYNPEGSTNAQVRWQCRNSGALNEESKIGKVNKDAVVPRGFLVDEKDNIIVTEVFYRFTPIFKTTFTGPFIVYRTALFRPRLGALTTAPGC